MTDGQSPDSGDASAWSPMASFLFNVQAKMLDDRQDHWAKNIPFREHFTRFAPTAPPSEAESQDTDVKKTFKTAREAHRPLFLDHFDGTQHADGAETSTLKRPPLQCRCHSCTGTRLQVFYQDLIVWATQFHFENCMQHGTPCNMFCPGQPTAITDPASLTPEHLEFAEQHGWNANAVLTGVGFGTRDRPAHCRNYDSAHGIKDVQNMLKLYKDLLHDPFCTPVTPCRTWCFKAADQLTADEIKNAKKEFPEWQRRMLSSEGMATAMHANVLEKKERKKRKKKKVATLSKPENQWSEAPFELSAFLGVLPRLHKPTCCREFPCISLCVCFPEEA